MGGGRGGLTRDAEGEGGDELRWVMDLVESLWLGLSNCLRRPSQGPSNIKCRLHVQPALGGKTLEASGSAQKCERGHTINAVTFKAIHCLESVI